MTSRAGKRGLIGMRRKLLTHDNNFVDGANPALTWVKRRLDAGGIRSGASAGSLRARSDVHPRLPLRASSIRGDGVRLRSIGASASRPRAAGRLPRDSFR